MPPCCGNAVPDPAREPGVPNHEPTATDVSTKLAGVGEEGARQPKNKARKNFMTQSIPHFLLVRIGRGEAVSGRA
jgi:hypothetical protein